MATGEPNPTFHLTDLRRERVPVRLEWRADPDAVTLRLSVPGTRLYAIARRERAAAVTFFVSGRRPAPSEPAVASRWSEGTPLDPRGFLGDLDPLLAWRDAVVAARDLVAQTVTRLPRRLSAAGAQAKARIDDALRGVAAATLERADPAAMKVALPFHPLSRLDVYARVARDPTGRARQLAETCPGALLVMSALSHHEGGVAREISQAMRLTIGGKKLRDVLARVVAAAEIDPNPRRIRRGAVGRWALLVQKAAPLVDPRHLLEPPPDGFAIEDVPSDPACAALWFSVLHAARPLPPGDGQARRRLAGFLSRHGVELARRCLTDAWLDPSAVAPSELQSLLAAQVGRILRWSLASGRSPGRNSRLDEVLGGAFLVDCQRAADHRSSQGWS